MVVVVTSDGGSRSSDGGCGEAGNCEAGSGGDGGGGWVINGTGGHDPMVTYVRFKRRPLVMVYICFIATKPMN